MSAWLRLVGTTTHSMRNAKDTDDGDGAAYGTRTRTRRMIKAGVIPARLGAATAVRGRVHRQALGS